MTVKINEIDKVEILTLQDNYIDVLSRDSSKVVERANVIDLETMQARDTILAEHGFSCILWVTKGKSKRGIIFDFGYSPHGAASNAAALNVDFSNVEAAALSHGHMDHYGGMAKLFELSGKKGIDLVLHPDAFRSPRFGKFTNTIRLYHTPFSRELVKEIGLNIIETRDPYLLLDGDLLFLGEIPMVTDFEKGMSIAYYMDGEEEKQDDIPDDTSLIANVRGKGLVILSGCAHAGIINTILHSKKVSGIADIFAVMGGFHLTGPEMKPAIEPTAKSLKEIDPTYVIPAHCTGRNATLLIEKEMPDRFLINMSGTKMTFKA